MSELIVDADLLVYRFSHSSQKVVEWDDGMVTMHGDLDAAQVEMDAFLHELLEQTNCDKYTLVLSDTGASYRKELCPTYKAGRGVTKRPMLFGPLRKLMLDGYGALLEPSLEGDDLVGILGTEVEGRVMASIDKDLLNVPGLHFNWMKDENGVREVTPGEANLHFLTQVLTGDHTDGFTGIPGIGPKRAAKIMEAAEAMLLPMAWRDVIVPAYEKAGLNEDVALMYARCAWVLRHGDYDFETKEVRLWVPGR